MRNVPSVTTRSGLVCAILTCSRLAFLNPKSYATFCVGYQLSQKSTTHVAADVERARCSPMFGRDVVVSYGATTTAARTCCIASPAAVVPFWQQSGNQMLLEAEEDGGRSTAATTCPSCPPSAAVPPVLSTSSAAVSAETSLNLANLRVALEQAVDSGHIEELAVKPILVMANVAALQNGSGDGSQLHVAAGLGQKRKVTALLAEGAEKNSLDTKGRSPLHLAVENGHLSTVKALLAANSDTSIRYRVGYRRYSVLDLAAQRGDACIVRAILHHGIDVNRRTDGYTSIHIAALNNKVAAIDALVEGGANVEVDDDFDCTPFLDACGNHCQEAALALFKHGANIEARDMRGETPLQIAARQAGREGVTAIVDMLLRCGADETALNPDGRTAAEIVGHHIDYAACPLDKQDVDRVRELLANALVDRAWRRRGFLVLCRAFWPKARRLRAASISSVAQISRGDGSDVHKSDPNDWSVGGGRRKQKGLLVLGGGIGELNTQSDKAAASNLHSVLTRVLGLAEEGLFRTIVGFL